jgi:hypothetical protein
MESGKLTPDGGMIFAGWTTSQYLVPYQQICLIKTDSNGCDGTQWTCGISYLEELAKEENNNLILYPNPVRENLHVSLNNSELNNNVQITNNNVQLSTNVKDSEFPLGEGGLRGIDNSLTKDEFNNLTIDQKLKYSSKNLNNKLWGEKEEQEMRELSRKFAYALPFEVIRGEVDIFAIDPALAMRVESEKLKVESIENAKHLEGALHLTKIEVIIYDIFGREVSRTFLFDNNTTIDVSNLQKGIYFIKLGKQVAKFVKE